MDKIKLGVSLCLLGKNVRYDGGHKLDHFIVDMLGKYFEFYSVCPELECGMGIPREALRLEGNPNAPRLVTHHTKKDCTKQMIDYSEQRLKAITKENLCGYILKSKSPSCGMERLCVYQGSNSTKNGVGIFARALLEKFPLLPIEDEGRLHDPLLRENFIQRIFIMKRWNEMTKKHADLVEFHTRHKMIVLAHGPKEYTLLGRIVAQKGDRNEYFTILMAALKKEATRKKHVNVLEHLMGYFKKELDSKEKIELKDIIEKYYNGHVPLIVPVTLINHYVNKFEKDYLATQFYLNPHPIELHLLNHV